MKTTSLLAAAGALTASVSLADGAAHTMDTYHDYLENNGAEIETNIENKLGQELSLVRLWPEKSLPQDAVTSKNAANACGEFNTPYYLNEAVRVLNLPEAKVEPRPTVTFFEVPVAEQGEEFICLPGASYAFKLEPNL